MFTFLQGRLVLVRLLMLAATAALIAIGIAAIYAAGHPAQPGPDNSFEEFAGLWKRQLIFAAVGFLGFAAINLFNYRRLGTVSYALYAVVLGG